MAHQLKAEDVVVARTEPTEFDHELAWDRLAKPSFDILPRNLRELYERVCQQCDSLQQNGGDLKMPWPGRESDNHLAYEALIEDSADSLWIEFERVPYEDLAVASRVVYYYGHWSPDGHSRAGAGGSWKFASYADQMLEHKLKHFCPVGFRDRFGEGRGGDYYFDIRQGVLHACWSDSSGWGSVPVGLATPEVFQKSLADLSQVSIESMEYRHWPNEGRHIDQFKNVVSRFQSPEGTWGARQDLRREAFRAGNDTGLKALKLRSQKKGWRRIVKEGAERFRDDDRALVKYINSVQFTFSEHDVNSNIANLLLNTKGAFA